MSGAVTEMGVVVATTKTPETSLTADEETVKNVSLSLTPRPGVVAIPARSSLLRTIGILLLKIAGTVLVVIVYEPPLPSLEFWRTSAVKSMEEASTGSEKYKVSATGAEPLLVNSKPKLFNSGGTMSGMMDCTPTASPSGIPEMMLPLKSAIAPAARVR